MTVADLKAEIGVRLGSDSAEFYTDADKLHALNQAQRIFAFLTLCLEVTRPFDLTPGMYSYRMVDYWPDWICPLRLQYSKAPLGTDAVWGSVNGEQVQANEQALAPATLGKIRPASLTQLFALRRSFLTATGDADRYACIGTDLMVFNKTPLVNEGRTVDIKYARLPLPLVEDADTPEIPAVDHRALVDYAIPRLRMTEGGSEFRKSALEDLPRFFDRVKVRAGHIRARSRAQQYDHAPTELKRADLSRLIAKKGKPA